VKSLKDMAKPGLRVGIGHEKQCALGLLTQQTLAQSRLQEEVMKNVVMQSSTGDLLVNQLRTGSLDAVVAYVSNAVSAAEVLEAIPVDIPCALAVQPIAVARDATRKRISARLVDALRSRWSRGRASRPRDSGGAPMNRDDRRFLGALGILGGGYLLLILAMFAADLAYTSPGHLLQALATPEIRHAIGLDAPDRERQRISLRDRRDPAGLPVSRCEFRGRKFLNASSTFPSSFRLSSSG